MKTEPLARAKKGKREKGCTSLTIYAARNARLYGVSRKMSNKLTKNIGVIVPYEEGMRLYTGKTIFDAETMRQFTTPIDFIQAGKLTLEDDVTPELISQKIQRFINYGKISVPTVAYGAFMAKCEENMGMIVKE